MRGNVYVAPHGSAWEVKFQGSGRFSSLHRHRDSAFAAARATARRTHTTVVICTEELWENGFADHTSEGIYLPEDTEENIEKGQCPFQEIMPIMIFKGKKALLF